MLYWMPADSATGCLFESMVHEQESGQSRTAGYRPRTDHHEPVVLHHPEQSCRARLIQEFARQQDAVGLVWAG